MNCQFQIVTGHSICTTMALFSEEVGLAQYINQPHLYSIVNSHLFNSKKKHLLEFA